MTIRVLFELAEVLEFCAGIKRSRAAQAAGQASLRVRAKQAANVAAAPRRIGRATGSRAGLAEGERAVHHAKRGATAQRPPSRFMSRVRVRS